MEDQRADPEVVYQLLQMGFTREACVRAAVSSNNDLQRAAALLADRREGREGSEDEDAARRRSALESERVQPETTEGAGISGNAMVVTGSGDGPWSLVGGLPDSPLSVLSGVDHFNIHDTVRSFRE